MISVVVAYFVLSKCGDDLFVAVIEFWMFYAIPTASVIFTASLLW